MKVLSDHENLAWAAGIIDGEGCFYSAKKRSEGHAPGVGFEVTQASFDDNPPEMLLRLQEVFPFARLGGPYGPYRISTSRPIYRLRVDNFEKVQQVMAMVWPWLGEVKRSEAITALDLHREAWQGYGWHRKAENR